MVSSLPFLAPVCMKKARDYRSKYSGKAYGSGASHSRGLKNSDHYQLSDVSHDKSAFVSTNKSGSEENILQNNAIMKSVTYTVHVDDDKTGTGKVSRRRQDSDTHV